MSRVLLTGLLLMTASFTAHAGPSVAAAGYGDAHPGLRFELVAQSNGAIGPGEAARAAREAYGGRVLAVHQVEGGAVYRVRLLVGGQVRVVLVDARNGRVLR